MRTKKLRTLIFALSSALIFVALIVTFIASFLSFSEIGYARDYVDFSAGWLDENGEVYALDRFEQSCRIYKQIPQLNVDSILSFNARNLDIDVYIGDELVYKTSKTQDPLLVSIYGKTAGSIFVEVPILREHSGQTVCIEAHNPYSSGSGCKIVHMFLGNGLQIIKHDASIQLGAFCFSILILFLGIICLLLYIPMIKTDIADRSMLYLGITAFTFGMSMITDCKMLHVVVGHETLYYTVSQLFMALIPIPLLLFFSQLYGSLNQKVVIVLGFANIIDFITMFVLNCFGIIDQHENTGPILLLCAGSILYIAVMTVRDIIKEGNKNTFHNIGVIMIAVSVVLDVIMSRSDMFVETSFFMRFGIAGFTFMECTQVVWKHLQKYQDGLKAQLVSRLAYHDGLTDLLNRTSFIEDLDRMEQEAHSDTLLAMFDVNNLKYVNDTFGHTDGDELIINVAETLRQAFGELGKIYRIGGDEFVFIGQAGNIEAHFLKALDSMRKELKAIAENAKYPVSVAAGYAVMDQKHHTMKDLLDDADTRMYANKKEMKNNMLVPMG